MKIPVGILGATGMVGQQYLFKLINHPYFELSFLAASSASSGKTYAEAVKGRWYLEETLPEEIGNLPLHSIDDLATAKERCRLVFSAVDSAVAKNYEERYAEMGLAVVSNASYHRQSVDVPILIPEINADHLAIIANQRKNRGWKKGLIVVKPNCSLQSYMIPLAPLHQQFQVKRLVVTTLQAISGAGVSGLSSLSILDNVIPYIAQEERKSEIEPLKIWGKIEGDQIIPASDIAIAAHCNRVPVVDGHMACLSVAFSIKPKIEEILPIWEHFEGAAQQLQLPSAPKKPILYREESDRPQPRLDRLTGKGMVVTVGRLRECPVFDLRFTALSHNTIRGAAGGGILNAELLVAKGWVS